MRETNLNPEPIPTILDIPPKNPKKIPVSTFVGVILALLFTSTISLAYYSFVYKPSVITPPVPTSTPRFTPHPTFSSFSTPTKTITSVPTDKPLVPIKLNLGEISWLQYPQPIKLNILKSSTGNYDQTGCYNTSTVKMHKTGTFSDGSYLVNLYIDCEEMGGGTELHRFIYSPNKQIYSIEDHPYVSVFSTPVKIADINIKGIESPENIKLPNISIKLSHYDIFNRGFYLSFTEIKYPQKIYDSPYGPIYISYPQKKGYEPIVGRYFYLRHSDDTVSNYDTQVDFFTDDRTPKFTYLDGTSNKDQYYTGLKTGGCGAVENGFIKSNDLNINDLTKIGSLTNTSNEHRDIFRITNPDNPIVKLLFKDFSPFGNQDITTVAEYAKLPTHFLWQDNYGDWNIFGNEKYGNGAECAKPVIYLYPQKDTQVNVQVGANITISEPQYPDEGWKVLAHPSGQIEYQGKTYPNLFWEGTGFGQYPEISNRGFVVTQKELIPTIKKHLSLQGLNSQEISDFLEFWTNKLPKTEFVRLTWLTTKEMNTLAPIQVFPRPDTAIRIFLDFEGLQNKISLIPQTLISVPRKGFTLIEWGGLLVK